MVYDEKLEGYFIEAEYTDKNRITYAYRYGYTTSADGGRCNSNLAPMIGSRSMLAIRRIAEWRTRRCRWASDMSHQAVEDLYFGSVELSRLAQRCCLYRQRRVPLGLNIFDNFRYDHFDLRHQKPDRPRWAVVLCHNRSANFRVNPLELPDSQRLLLVD